MADEETYLTLDGVQYLRVPVHARLRATDADEVPAALQSHIQKATAAKKQMYWQDSENPDLVWVNFILDSEGINKNNDYMPRTQLMASFRTARHKPLDMEHVVKETKSLVKLDKENPSAKNTIYGVMTASALGDHNGRLLTDKQIEKLDKTDDPDRDSEDKLTVVAWAALYYFLFPETVKEIVKVIDKGEMYVSMERWLRRWDYLVQKPNSDPGDFSIVTKETAEKDGTHGRWMTKQYINGAPVVRRTLNYSYGGVATTANPANELSRFINQTKERVKAAAALAEDPVMQHMVACHDEVAAAYASASNDEERATCIMQHSRIHKAIAAYIG